MEPVDNQKNILRMYKNNTPSQNLINSNSSSFIKNLRNCNNKFQCPQKMKADLICISQTCQKYPFFTHQCQVCTQQHGFCPMILLKKVNQQIIKKIQVKNDQMAESTNEIDIYLNKIIEKVQKVRQQFKQKLSFTSLSSEQTEYVKIINERSQNQKSLQQIPKKLLLQIIKNLNSKFEYKAQAIQLIKKELYTKMRKYQDNYYDIQKKENQKVDNIEKKNQKNQRKKEQEQKKQQIQGEQEQDQYQEYQEYDVQYENDEQYNEYEEMSNNSASSIVSIKSNRKDIENQQIQNNEISRQDKQYVKSLINNKFRSNRFQIDQEKTYVKGLYCTINYPRLKYMFKLPKLINPSIIKTLWLGRNLVCDNCIQFLFRKEFKWIALQQLILEHNKITMKGVQYLSQAAEMKLFLQLQTLDLHSNLISSQKNITESKNEQQSLQEGLMLKFTDHNTKLKHLILKQNNINDNDMLKLFKFKPNNSSNQKLKIFYHLMHLDLEVNKITKDGIKTLVGERGLSLYPSLSVLIFGNNRIKTQGIEFLFHNTNNNKKSQSNFLAFYSEYNFLCCQTIKILLQNKSMFNNLKLLWIDGNHIGDEGIIYFLKGCQEGAFPLLQILGITDIDMSDKGIDELASEDYRYIKNNKSENQKGNFQQKQQSLKFLKKIQCYKNIKVRRRTEGKKKLTKRFKKNKTSILIFDYQA